MENDFIIFRIFKRITDFSNLVGYPPNPPDQLTINIYKIKKKFSHLSYLIFLTKLSFFSLTLSHLSSLNLQTLEAPPSCKAPSPRESHLPHSSRSQSPSPSLIFFSVSSPAKGDRVELHRWRREIASSSTATERFQILDLARSRRIW
jgi:hypothetical protein